MCNVGNPRYIERCTTHDNLGNHAHFYDRFEKKDIIHILKKNEDKVEIVDLDYA